MPGEATEFYTPPPKAHEDPNLGSTLHGKYRVRKRIGDRGGMGNVYQGLNIRANVPVAIKILKEEYQNEDSLARRFQQEGSLALEHDNIVKIYEVQNTDLPAYIVMELLEGNTLANLIQKRGPLPEFMVKDIFVQVLNALEFLHAPERGILHRDIKPSNIMLLERERDRYEVRLIDFGIAKRAGGTTGEVGITRWDPTPICTPQYAPHEQFLSMAGVTAQSDLYSVAVCIYEALTGQLPYDIEKKVEQGKVAPESRREAYFAAHQSGSFVKPTRLRKGITPQWNRILSKGLDPDKNKRYAGAAEFRDDILGLAARGAPWRRLAPVAGAVVVLFAVLSWPWASGSGTPPKGTVPLSGGKVTLPGGGSAYVGDLFVQPAEVSNRDYAAFVAATKARIPGNWDPRTMQPPAGSLDAPVTSISLGDAQDYAAWAGLRLPTEAEWQRLADAGPPVKGIDGGIAEWTETTVDPSGEHCVVRGGSADHRTGGALRGEVSFAAREPWIGFRCVASGPAPRLYRRLLGAF